MKDRDYGISIKKISTNEEFTLSFINSLDVAIQIVTPQGELIKAYLGEVIDTVRRCRKLDLKLEP